MTGTPSRQLATIYHEATYDAYKGWSTLAQPEKGFQTFDYHSIAQAAAPVLSKQMRTFMDEHGYSYIEIPADDFRIQFEQSDLEFRPWLNQWAQGHGVSSNVDFAIVGPSIKTLESANRKEDERISPERIVDYLRIMGIALNGQGPFKDVAAQKKLPLFRRAMDDLERNGQTVARKNLFWKPHSTTRFRALKALWITGAEEGSGLEGYSTLSEVKLQREDDMSLDKLTRRFLELQRQTSSFLCSAYNVSPTNIHRLAKRLSSAARHVNSHAEQAKIWGYLLCDRSYDDSGADIFLNPSLADEYAPLSHEAIAEHILKDLESFTSGMRDKYRLAIARSGILPIGLLGFKSLPVPTYEMPNPADSLI